MSETSEGEEFEGFSIPEKNYFPMPNNWTDICAKIDNLSELKVIQYVIRHTWGYQEYGGYKTISVDEFMHGRRRQDRTRMDNGTGLSEPSVKDGLKRAIKHGYLVCITDDKDKGRVKKSYGLKMHEASERGKKLTGQETYPVGNLSPEGKKLIPRGQETYPRTEKDTIEKHLKKNTKESVCDTAESTPPRDTHTSFENSSREGEQDGSLHSHSNTSGNEHGSQSVLHIPSPAPDTHGATRDERRQEQAPLAEPTTQAHSVGAAMSTTAPRTPNSPPLSGVRGVPLQDHNRVGSPPADDKSQTNKLSKQELALRRKWAKYVTEYVSRETVIIALQLRSAWLEAYGPYGDAEWDNQALLWLSQQENGTFENVQKVVERWAKVKPDEPIHPEMVKNKWFWASGKPQKQPNEAGGRQLGVSGLPKFT